MTGLSIKKAGKLYGSVRVLQDINIDIDEGEFLVLVGPSGCGKSTLLNMIAGLEEISEGEISIAGNVVNDLEPSERDIAMVFQSYALYPTMTVAGNISFGLEIRRVPKAERDAAVAKVADLLQIGHLLDRKPSQLSGGQRQRVAMGRALVRDPKLFLFDEPLSNLDAKLRVEMRTEIKKLHKKTGKTIVYVTHDQIEAMTMATRICVLEGGDIQQQGTPDEIYNNPANAFVAGFMGSPPMNLMKARARKSAEGWGLTISHGLESITLPYPRNLPDSYDNRVVTLGMRPEQIVEEYPRDAAEDAYYTTTCTLDLTEPTGADTFGAIDLSGLEAICKLKPGSRADTGDQVELHFEVGAACVFDPESGARLDC
ncbi:ABC transporter ATP-binding protein [Ruegeria atlantica]|uniref:ABC transporter ATP-binding protein n=1 Tax=Ruegeria atlantica TaxID=81569 RepID=UPI0014801C57|nr:sn-glycerol-3-phosphate ABC transporter ATP-binding protein UgpC [Ruegeria atlantica]